jgi:glutathione S-transferase
MNAITPITVSAFKWVPDFARGHVRDLRVRWALEEAGLPYESHLIGFEDQASPGYRALQPFGQVPAYREGDLTLFESGAIVLHIAQGSDALLPGDPIARARATAWLFSALNTMEPAIGGLADVDIFHAGEDWAKARRPTLETWVKKRLSELAARLGDNAYLDGDRFTAGDLMMATVLRSLQHTDLLAGEPVLADYLKRCEARPAFQAALAAQMADFVDTPPN